MVLVSQGTGRVESHWLYFKKALVKKPEPFLFLTMDYRPRTTAEGFYKNNMDKGKRKSSIKKVIKLEYFKNF